MNTITSSVGTGSRRPLAALYALAPLILMGCIARTPLRSPSGSSSEPWDEVDTGGQAGDVVVTAGSGGGIVAGATAQGGALGTGGISGTAGSPGPGGTSGGPGGGTRDAGGSPSTAGTSSGGGVSAVGGITTSGGRIATGGTISTVAGSTAIRGGSSGGGVTGTGNATATGGSARTGGSVSSGGRSATGGSVSSGGTPAAVPPTIQPDGYATIKTGTVVMAGHVSSYMSGSGSSLSLTYTSNSFCASGTVAADPTYSSWAGAGFNVNQAQSGASGSSGSLVLTGSTVTVSYVNRAGSTLEFQMYDGSNYWCAYLPAASSPTTTTIPFSKLNTQCWNGLGSSFTSGTPITAVQLMVPCSATVPVPFDFCFLGLTVQ